MEAPAEVAGLSPSQGRAVISLRLPQARGPKAAAQRQRPALPGSAARRRTTSLSEGDPTRLSLLGQAFVWARGSLAWPPSVVAPSAALTDRARADGAAGLANLLQ